MKSILFEEEDQTVPAIDAGVQSRALLVSLNYHCWTNKRNVPEADPIVAAHFGIDDTKSTRTQKYLIARSRISPIERAIWAIVREHNRRTLPWLDGGTRILATAGYFDYMQMLRTMNAKLQAEVAKLAADWDRLVDESIAKLKGLAKRSDYPAADELFERFSIECDVWPVSDPRDVRVQLSDEEVGRIKEQVTQQNDKRLQGAYDDITRRVKEVAERCEYRLRNYKPATGDMVRAESDFKSSLITNATELADLLPTLNIANDERFVEIERDLRQLAQYDMKDLKSDSGCRQTTADRAAAIVAKLDGFLS